MSKGCFRAAAVQTLAVLGDYKSNIEIATHYVEEAVRQGAELIVFPECMDTGYLFDSAEHARELAETVTDGPFVSALSSLAREHGVYIASGITEWDPVSERVFNSGVMFDRQGELVCHYQKQFLATHDQNWFEFGERGCPVVDTDLGRIGLLICFDGRIPEIFRSMALQGAEIIVDMANFFTMDQADVWGPARAYENGLWLVAATKAGYERSIYYPGGSMIADPNGRVVSKVPYDTHGLAVATIEPSAARNKAIYSRNDKIADRRPDTYGRMTLPYAESSVARLAETPIVPSKATSKVAAVQMHVTRPGRNGDTASLRDTLDMVSHGAKLGINVMVLPEYALCEQWLPTAEHARLLADQTDAAIKAIGAITTAYGCMVALPTVEREGDRLYSTTFLIGTDGQVAGKYRKVHLSAEEREWAEPGTDYPVFETRFGRLGIMAGYDALFPESSRCLAIDGADIILWPASLREPQERELIAIPRAEDNRVVVVLANRCDSPYPGGSLVIPATGFPLWDINQVAPRVGKLGVVMPMHVDLAVCRQKQMIPKVDMFANRLVETYGPIVAGA
ncbi:carbon-nitrogen hydrolase family protein [Alloalcanivorax sp. C16-1]|uniref:carbon-nitrogen hydrolase family protein n=1 Tax=Alloalcanivorax sp. C16-1 TaxID=3390051 RepID=UPI0039707198